MPQRIRDFAVAALALVVVIAALAGLDDRVPAYLKQAATAVVSGNVAPPGSPLGNVVASVAASPAMSDGFVAALLVAAVVLMFLLVKS